jgi:RNA recognition motif-containing protein
VFSFLLGFGFATFNTEEAQVAAQKKMDGFELDGRELVVKIAKETETEGETAAATPTD